MLNVAVDVVQNEHISNVTFRMFNMVALTRIVICKFCKLFKTKMQTR